MKLKFKTQAYQTAAVDAVVRCFEGQPMASLEASRYGYDTGVSRLAMADLFDTDGFKNADITLSEEQLKRNIRKVQEAQGLPLADKVVKTKVAPVNLDIEMETGTGKTYCYIKTIFELNRTYGWTKFIIVVPSIAIREGVAKSLEITAEHFQESYGKRARFFIYNSQQLHQLESFSSDAGINVMVINVQAFNATGKDNRRIYEELDSFQSRKPIDVISANRPILILDEPQKMEGSKTLDSLVEFRPLFVLRYSATHKTEHNKIHRLDALDAYQQKLVKKIAVRGISVNNFSGTTSYLYLHAPILISASKPPEARVEFEQKLANGSIKRVTRKLGKGDNLFELSNGLDQYREGFVVADINANTDTLSFTNGVELSVGEATGDVTESLLRRLQIREAIKAHVDKEQRLFQQGIKVLTLFFIDEVARYRDYSADDEKGEYARIFEEEYNQHLNEVLELHDTPYQRYLKGIETARTHNGYFSIDKKGRQVDSTFKTRGENAGMSDDVAAYDLILKDKERLLSFEEPTRFIFSHSALREGWDNPNVFVICTLKHSGSIISRRQEVGRGLRLAVNQQGERMDNPATVHDINVLTVVASESYKKFVTELQKDISESLSARPRKITLKELEGIEWPAITGEPLTPVSTPVPGTPPTTEGASRTSASPASGYPTPDGQKKVSESMLMQVLLYLQKHAYLSNNEFSPAYFEARDSGTLAPLPGELAHDGRMVFALIDWMATRPLLPEISDDNKPKTNPLNANFHKQEFKALWERINRKAVYTVAFDDDELIGKAIKALNDKNTGLQVPALQFTVERGEQVNDLTYDSTKAGRMFIVQDSATEATYGTVHSTVKYDLVGKLAEGTQLTRRTVAKILMGMNEAIFAQFRYNPEGFITGAVKIINEQKATMIVEHLSYDALEERFDTDIFTMGQNRQDFRNAVHTPKHHIYDYVLPDSGSKPEREFAEALEASEEVVVYAKLPRGFLIPTPVGDYNPDWAIAFREGSVKHIYFVAETKGSLASMDLRGIEQTKIGCARKFFEEMNRRMAPENVRYDVVTDFEGLMGVVK